MEQPIKIFLTRSIHETSFLVNARKTQTISARELSNVISQITGVKEASFESEPSNSSLKPGEYVAVY